MLLDIFLPIFCQISKQFAAIYVLFLEAQDGRYEASSSYFLRRLPQKSFGFCYQDDPDQAQESRRADADEPRLQRLHGLPVEMGRERPQRDPEPGLGQRGCLPDRDADGRGGGHGSIA